MPVAPSSGASCVCWNSARNSAFLGRGKGPLLKKGLPSPCTPIPPKTFIPLRAPGLKLRSRAAGLSPLLLWAVSLPPSPILAALPLPGLPCPFFIDGGAHAGPATLPSACTTHALPGWLTGRRSPLFAWPPHTSPMPVRIPCPHGGGAMESITVRRIFRHPLWMARADKPPLPPARHRLPCRLPDRPINALFVLRVCRFRECRSTHAPKFLEIS